MDPMDLYHSQTLILSTYFYLLQFLCYDPRFQQVPTFPICGSESIWMTELDPSPTLGLYLQNLKFRLKQAERAIVMSGMSSCKNFLNLEHNFSEKFMLFLLLQENSIPDQRQTISDTEKQKRKQLLLNPPPPHALRLQLLSSTRR